MTSYINKRFKKKRSRGTCHDDGVQDKVLPNTTELDKSDLSFSIKDATGFNISKNNKPMVSLLKNREQGIIWNSRDKCTLNNYYIPNQMREIARHNNRVFCGTFSRDGNFLITSVHDKSVKLYDTSQGDYKVLKKYQVSGVGWSILDIAFSPDKSSFVYSSWSESLYLHSIRGNTDSVTPLVLNIEHPMFCIFSIRFSSDGKELFGGGNDNALYIYDLQSETNTKVKGLNRQINCVALADDSSQILYTAGDDGLCKVWDRRVLREENPEPVGVLAGHVSGITYVDPRGDGRHLITNSKDQTIKLWDTRKFSKKQAVEDAKISVVIANISWDYSGQHVPKKFTSSFKPLDGDTSIMTYRGHVVLQTLIRCHFSPLTTTGQRYIYTGCASGAIIIYDTLTGKIEKTLDGHRFVVRDVSWHPTRPEIVSASWDGVVACWRYRYDSSTDESSTDSED